MKKRMSICIVLIFLITCPVVFSSAKLDLTDAERAYLSQSEEDVLKVGLDPLGGMDYFTTWRGEQAGVVVELLKKFERDTGLSFEIVDDRTWNEVYQGLHTGDIDILLGANETQERLKTMSFTDPLYQRPYAIFTLKETEMFTIGDLDNRNVGFMQGDYVVDELAEQYTYLDYTPHFYEDQEAIFEGLESGRIEAAVFSGGSVIYKFLYEHPELKYVAPIESVESDITLSVRNSRNILSGILNKEIQFLRTTGEMEDIVNSVEVSFVREVINLTPKERWWLENHGHVIVGITKDYLPIDYFSNGQYSGVSGAVFTELARITGMHLSYAYNDFNVLHDYIAAGKIDVLNIVRTDDREKYLNFSDPYSYERDIIVGLNSSEEVIDVYGLEGKRVAVVEGFWHEDYLKKNLLSVDIVITQNVVESMEAVLNGKADYFIENPTVVKFYIAENDYYTLIEKGVTSSDSNLYFGLSKRQPELLSIINKTLPLIDLKTLQKKGYQSVPLAPRSKTEARLLVIIICLVTALTFIGIRLKRTLEELISTQATAEILKQRQILEYTDVMTGLMNRNYFYKEVEPFEGENQRLLSVLMCDVDRLKFVNDTYGHPVGDQLIVEVAKILRQVVDDAIVPIRMGGDEFLLVLPGYDENQCKEVIGKIKQILQEVDIKTDDGVLIEIYLSMGYAVRKSFEENLEHVILRADNDMYMNKRSKYMSR